MAKQKVSDITPELLIKDGWVENEDKTDPFRFEKKLPNRNPLNASEDSDISLVLHFMYNCPTFAIAIPDGAMLNFVANSMKELKFIETRINFYDPPF